MAAIDGPEGPPATINISTDGPGYLFWGTIGGMTGRGFMKPCKRRLTNRMQLLTNISSNSSYPNSPTYIY